MRLGVLADAHGNLAGLKTCLHFLRQRDVEHYLFLGDATGYFPQSAAICEELDALPLTLVAGNHEGMLMGILPMNDAMREVIQPPDTTLPPIRHWLQRCTRTGPMHHMKIGGKNLCMVHGSPDNPWLGRIDSPDTFPMKECDILLSAHTHRPGMTLTSDGRLYVNPGSCGYPRDNGAWLSVAVVDTVEPSAQIFRLPNRIDTPTLQWVHPAVRQTLQRRFPITGTIVEMP